MLSKPEAGLTDKAGKGTHAVEKTKTGDRKNQEGY